MNAATNKPLFTRKDNEKGYKRDVECRILLYTQHAERKDESGYPLFGMDEIERPKYQRSKECILMKVIEGTAAHGGIKEENEAYES